jgi:Flp pilus assembly protein TadG
MAALLRLLRRGRTCESGAEFVEMALAFPLLLLVVLGIMDFGIMFQRYEVITNAAREGARIAILPDYCPDNATCDANVLARVNQYVGTSFLGGAGPVSVTVGTPVAASIGGLCMTTRTVWVFYPHQFEYLAGIMSYFGGSFGSRTLTAASTMREDLAGAACAP